MNPFYLVVWQTSDGNQFTSDLQWPFRPPVKEFAPLQSIRPRFILRVRPRQ